MMNLKTISNVFIFLLIIGVLASCNKSEMDTTNSTGTDPFSNGGTEKNMIVVISDIHLGADLSYAECSKNLPALEKFIKQVGESKNVKELVIAGDLLDEWFVPANIDTYKGKDQADFVKRIAAANKGVIDALNNIIKGGKILVTYVPGNHDLTITAENVNSILPGINQARDKELGLGTYSPVDYPKIAIEHGHRYNLFCAPDKISNQDVAPGTILPPGYFYTRIAALYVVQNRPAPIDSVPVVTLNAKSDENQKLLFAYWGSWAKSLKMFTIKNKFDEKIIVTNVDGFTGNYSVNDFLPYQTKPGGKIEMILYKGMIDTWEQRQTLNNVPVHIPIAHAIAYVGSSEETDNQAKLQYFMNPNSDKRIVVFGHSHDPRIISSQNHQGQKSVYVNTGTWIDHNPKQTTMQFLVITPQNTEASSQTYLKLYNFEGQVANKMAEDSLRY